MGYLNSDHIKTFVAGQTIVSLDKEDDVFGCFRLRFKSGESLRLCPHKQGCECCKVEIIATPFGADSQVKQSTEIE